MCIRDRSTGKHCLITNGAESGSSVRRMVFSFLKTVGSARPDPKLDTAAARIKELSKCVAETSDCARLSAQHLEAACNAQRGMVKKLMSVWKDEAPEAEIAPCIKGAFESLSAEIPEKMLPVLETLILQPLFEWSERLNELKDPMKICTPEKLLVDHYEDKLVELRHDAEKRRAKGRPESQKQMDQFQRNVAKQEEAVAAYEQVRDAQLSKIYDELRGSKDVVNQHMKRILQFTQAFFTKAYQAVGDDLTPPMMRLDELISSPPHRADIDPNAVPDTKPHERWQGERLNQADQAMAEQQSNSTKSAGRAPRKGGLDSSSEDSSSSSSEHDKKRRGKKKKKKKKHHTEKKKQLSDSDDDFGVSHTRASKPGRSKQHSEEDEDPFAPGRDPFAVPAPSQATQLRVVPAQAPQQQSVDFDDDEDPFAAPRAQGALQTQPVMQLQPQLMPVQQQQPQMTMMVPQPPPTQAPQETADPFGDPASDPFAKTNRSSTPDPFAPPAYNTTTMAPPPAVAPTMDFTAMKAQMAQMGPPPQQAASQLQAGTQNPFGAQAPAGFEADPFGAPANSVPPVSAPALGMFVAPAPETHASAGFEADPFGAPANPAPVPAPAPALGMFVAPETAPDPFASNDADPFASSGDPFVASNNADPFAGDDASAVPMQPVADGADPFGGSGDPFAASNSTDPFSDSAGADAPAAPAMQPGSAAGYDPFASP
eukprot:TRINITY_DN167_c0_g2_i4.p1 TRINITY_DN167_c0_g2~~TRINITY_DN167_c0_g2_i4.p1  ORF type:complete len:711 (+),score=206.24 TRINITY_DN167_c0_g2_i4:122-2254(+)